MRIAGLGWLLVVASAVLAPGQSGLATEDTSDIQRVLKAQDPSLGSFRMIAKRQFAGPDAPVGLAVAVVEAKYEMLYPPEIAPWSGSAILLDGTDLWIGLTRRPGGASVPGGLLRFNIRNGVVRKYSVADYIYTLDAIGGTLYCGTSNGLATVRGDLVTAFRFEPDANGKNVMVRGGTGTLLP